MGTHKKSDHKAREVKYQRQVARTLANKKRNINKMMAQNPNWKPLKEYN